jgi:hypothetical protein
MTTAPALESKASSTFPADLLGSRLRAELVDAAKAVARRRACCLPPTPDEIAAFPMEIDSLGVVEVLCVLDSLVPFQVDESVVKAGGYGSINEAVRHVTSRIERAWRKYEEGATS